MMLRLNEDMANAKGAFGDAVKVQGDCGLDQGMKVRETRGSYTQDTFLKCLRQEDFLMYCTLSVKEKEKSRMTPSKQVC